MSTKRFKLINRKFRKERAILSDVLPYEVPISFTNRHFYNFLIESRVHIKNGELAWKSGSSTLDNIIHMLFGLNKNPGKTPTKKIYIGSKHIKFNYYKLTTKNRKEPYFIPFEYKINHKDKEFRDLAIPHPHSQVRLVNFYNECKEMILYHCSQSSFSIRRPVKLAKYRYYKDRTHYDKLIDNEDSVEESGKEYENLRSFFVYKNYSNIHRFYESYKFHRCEKKYNRLLRLDISKCFESIYTHSISWAVFGKPVAKGNISKINKSVAGQFDEFMQSINYQETNGIIIGPEFSRIFAEIILQAVDKHLELELRDKGLQYKTHYEIYRYVDDYFIFYNEERDKDTIVKLLQANLKKFKLHRNPAKDMDYHKPIITDITRAKIRISELLKQVIECNRNYEHIATEYTNEAHAGVEASSSSEVENDKSFKCGVCIDSELLITKFKAIIKESEVSYKDLLNYSLAIVESRSEKILNCFNESDITYDSKVQITKAVVSILDFVFFIYSVSPRVNTTIRLCRIIRMFCSLYNLKTMQGENQRVVFKCIYDNARLVLNKNKNNEFNQIETLYLLIVLTELGKDYRLEEKILAEYFNINLKAVEGNDLSLQKFNYFTFTVALFYMKNIRRYNRLRVVIEKGLKERIVNSPDTFRKHAELTMLAFDTLSCPYVSMGTKKSILKKYGISNSNQQEDILGYRNGVDAKQMWFTTWENFDFGKELDAKLSHEVY